MAPRQFPALPRNLPATQITRISQSDFVRAVTKPPLFIIRLIIRLIIIFFSLNIITTLILFTAQLNHVTYKQALLAYPLHHFSASHKTFLNRKNVFRVE